MYKIHKLPNLPLTEGLQTAIKYNGSRTHPFLCTGDYRNKNRKIGKNPPTIKPRKKVYITEHACDHILNS